MRQENKDLLDEVILPCLALIIGVFTLVFWY